MVEASTIHYDLRNGMILYLTLLFFSSHFLSEAIFVVPRMTQPPLAINFFVNSITPTELLVAQRGCRTIFCHFEGEKAQLFSGPLCTYVNNSKIFRIFLLFLLQTLQ